MVIDKSEQERTVETLVGLAASVAGVVMMMAIQTTSTSGRKTTRLTGSVRRYLSANGQGR